MLSANFESLHSSKCWLSHLAFEEKHIAPLNLQFHSGMPKFMENMSDNPATDDVIIVMGIGC